MPQWRKLPTHVLESPDFNEMPTDLMRLTWILLPLILDREGRHLDSAVLVKSKLFPMREDVNADMVGYSLDWFAERGMIKRYQASGRHYFYAPAFRRYQGDTRKEAPSILPAPPDEQTGAVTESEPDNNDDDAEPAEMEMPTQAAKPFSLTVTNDMIAPEQQFEDGDNDPGELVDDPAQHAPKPKARRLTKRAMLSQISENGQAQVATSAQPGTAPGTVPGTSTDSDADADAIPLTGAARKRARSNRPTDGKSQADPRTLHPAIQAIHRVTGRFPPKPAYDAVIAALGMKPNLQKLTNCFNEAVVQYGKVPSGLFWATEWYPAGGREAFYRQGKTKAAMLSTQTVHKPIDDAERFALYQQLQERVQNGEEEDAVKKELGL